ncbi:Phytocyanin domain-containing protein [Psidium guajava]|nr:Phytocyanin domain-containing protein [Psidium guajava]
MVLLLYERKNTTVVPRFLRLTKDPLAKSAGIDSRERPECTTSFAQSDSRCRAGQKLAVNVTSATSAACFSMPLPPQSTFGTVSTSLCAFALFPLGH